MAEAQVTHGHTRRSNPSGRTLTYSSWRSMRERVNGIDPDHVKYYANVTICDRWQDSFEAFLSDMGERPSKLYTIDRMDPDKGYEPSNCRWADKTTQARNRRNSVRRGTTMAIMCAEAGFSKEAITHRMQRRGMTLEQALSTPRHRGVGAAPRFGEANNKAKFGADAVLEIRASKERTAVLAERFGVSPETIRNVQKRKTWSHIA